MKLSESRRFTAYEHADELNFHILRVWLVARFRTLIQGHLLIHSYLSSSHLPCRQVVRQNVYEPVIRAMPHCYLTPLNLLLGTGKARSRRALEQSVIHMACGCSTNKCCHVTHRENFISTQALSYSIWFLGAVHHRYNSIKA